MMKKVYKLVVLLLLCQTYVFAQNISVTGKVTDSDNLPLPAVSIKVSGSTQGTSTDANGNFTISVPSNASLVFTYIGFASQTIAVNGRTTLSVRLESDSKMLEGVIVTALGITKDQRVLSYATQQVKTESFEKARELNIGKSLIGRVAGLDVATTAGLGGSTRVVLRGDRSITGNNGALIVIDGVPMDNQIVSPGGASGGREGGDGLSSINPDNIESMTVLRGASATALYGSRAANGALLINTKKGSASKGTGVSFNSSSQLESAVQLIDFQNEYGQGSGGIFSRSGEGSWGPRMTGQSVALWGPDPADATKTYSFNAQPDNVRDFYSVGNQLSNTLAFSGGNEKAQTYLAYTRVDAKGIIDNNKLTRDILNLRITGKVSPKLSYDGKATYLKQDIDNRQFTGETPNNTQRHILRIPRNISTAQAQKYEFTDPSTGRLLQNAWNPGQNSHGNPYWTKNRILADDVRDRVTAFGSLTYQVTPQLSLMGRAGIDKTIDGYEGMWYDNTYTVADLGMYQTQFRDNIETNIDFIGIYKENLLKDLTVDATFGASLQQLDRTFQSTNTGQLTRANLFVPQNARGPQDSRTFVQSAKNGIFATADFTYKNAITFSGSVRNDWSSTLPRDNWSYMFGSAGFSAVLSNIFTLPQAVSFAKLRGSYATTGNDAQPFLTQQWFDFSPGGSNAFVSRGNTKPFPNLQPELTAALEFGLEAKFFNDRLGFDLGYYTSDSKNQLLSIGIPPASGWSFEFINAGLVNNRGVELTLNATPVIKGDFRWNVDLNWSRNINEIVELTPDLKILQTNSDFIHFQRAIEGQALGQMFSRGFQRNASGAIIVGPTGLPLVTSTASVDMGNTRPDWTGGFTNTFNYKSFSLSTLITARVGGRALSFTNAILAADGVLANTLEGRDAYVVPGVNAAGTPNTVATTAELYWKLIGGRNSPVGEAWGYSATNIRLREASLTYRLPKNLLKKAPFQAASVSLTGRNLFFIRNDAEGFDPEAIIGATNTGVGIESFSLPFTRQIGLNLNLSF